MLNSATMENICACFLKNPPKWRQCKLPIVLHIARLQQSLLKTKKISLSKVLKTNWHAEKHKPKQ